MAQWQATHKLKEKSPEPTSKLGTSVSVCNPNMLLGRWESDASLKAQKLGVCGGRMRDPASKWKVKTDTEVDLWPAHVQGA